MKALALVLFVIIQVVFIPFTILGLILVSYNQIVVSRKLDVSGTAVSAIGYRWIMHVFDIRKDPESVELYRELPNGSAIGLWLLFLPLYLRYKLGGRFNGFPFIAEVGKEGVLDVPATRTIHLDKLINRVKNEAEQFVVLGAGYDTRCYGLLKNTKLQFFELDKLQTQKLKIDCLQKAGIESSPVRFADVDFSSEHWYDKLAALKYDPRKKSVFLWEGVSVYLTENEVRKMLSEIKSHAAAGSKILMDLYDKRVLSFKGSRSTREQFLFGLDFTSDAFTTLETFILSNRLELGAYYFMGHKTEKGSLGVVVEVIV